MTHVANQTPMYVVMTPLVNQPIIKQYALAQEDIQEILLLAVESLRRETFAILIHVVQEQRVRLDLTDLDRIAQYVLVLPVIEAIL